MTAAPDIAGCGTVRRGSFILMRFEALILVVVSAFLTQFGGTGKSYAFC
jgi:hypothetical protein